MPIVGDCVREYLDKASDKKFIAFGVNVAHSEEIQRQFLAAGVPTGLYTYRTGTPERAEMIAEFRKPDSYLRGLISVSALAKGFDVEDVGCIIMARPLRKSLAEHVQIFGRGLRKDPADPAKECVVLDHSGNCLRFWEPMNAFFDEGAHELDDGKRKPKKKAERTKPEPRKCPQCAHVHPPCPACPLCGHEYPRRSIRHIAGELTELGQGPAVAREERAAVYAALLWIATDRGRKEGWAAHTYRERYGIWPRHEVEPAPPSPAIANWVKSRDIAWAKGKQKRARTDFRERWARQDGP
jgi:hypothetical protein